MGISCKFTGLGVINVDQESSLCQYYHKCTVADLLTIDKALLDDMQWRFPADLPFYHQCGSHAFGWYEIANLRAGTWLAFSKSISTFGLDGHATADTFAYVGNGGRNQATWAGNACQTTVDIANTRFFVRQQYKDFFAREPDPSSNFGGARDFGAGAWQMRIDAIANATQSRAQVALGFMQSPEFTAVHPALDPANIGTTAYNEEFVRQCYRVFFRREPDLGGFQFWLTRIRKSGGDYAGVIDGFLQDAEYLHRSACGFGPSYCN